MKTSVVIATYGRLELAKKLVGQIHMYNPDVETIVIDQTKGTPNLCSARNQGIKKSSGDIIIFFDDDVEITQKTISSHVTEYHNSLVVGVAGRVINDGEYIPHKSKVETGKMNDLGTLFVKNFWGTKKQTVNFPYGCNMSFRKFVLEKINGFDEKLPPPLSSFEEIDTGLRASKSGKIIFSPSALAYHHRAASGGTRMDDRRRKNLYYQSYGRLIRKHIRIPEKFLSVLILIKRILSESPQSLRYFFRGLISK